MLADRLSLPNEANRDRVAGFAKRSQRPGAWPGMAFCETKPTAGGTGGLSTSGIHTRHWCVSHQCHPEWQKVHVKPGPNRGFQRNPTAGCLGGHVVLRNEPKGPLPGRMLRAFSKTKPTAPRPDGTSCFCETNPISRPPGRPSCRFAKRTQPAVRWGVLSPLYETKPMPRPESPWPFYETNPISVPIGRDNTFLRYKPNSQVLAGAIVFHQTNPTVRSGRRFPETNPTPPAWRGERVLLPNEPNGQRRECNSPKRTQRPARLARPARLFTKRTQRPGSGRQFSKTNPRPVGGTGGLSTSGIHIGQWWTSHQCHPKPQKGELARRQGRWCPEGGTSRTEPVMSDGRPSFQPSTGSIALIQPRSRREDEKPVR